MTQAVGEVAWRLLKQPFVVWQKTVEIVAGHVLQ